MLTRSKPRNGTTTVTFTLPAGQPDGAVSVVGDFNDWQPGTHELAANTGRRSSNGDRSVAVKLKPGTHYFRYLGQGGNWFDDPDADQITPDGSVIEIG